MQVPAKSKTLGTCHLWIVSLLLICSLLTAISAWSQGEETAAVLWSDLPGDNPPTVEAVSGTLKETGYDVVTINADVLCDPAQLNAEKFSLLALPNAAVLPAASVAPIEAFVRAGGDILALGAPLWQTLLLKKGDAWVTVDDYEREGVVALPENLLFDFAPEDIADWQRACGPDSKESVYETVADGPLGRRVLHARVADLRGWDNFGPVSMERAFPEGHTLTIFAAKGDKKTRTLAVEWQERDGSRWIATVPLTTEWRQYTLTPKDFKFWESVPARAQDVLHPENVVRMNIGLAFTHTGMAGGPHEWWVSGFGTARMTPEIESMMIRPTIPAIDTLSPSYKLFDSTQLAQLKIRPQQFFGDPIPALGLPGGVTRSPHPRPNGAGFGKGRDWRWIPLIEAWGPNGQWRGTPATLMINVDGPFRGAQCAVFGVSESAWYCTDGAKACLKTAAERLLAGVYFADAGSNYFTYFDNQTMALGFRAANVGHRMVAGVTARVSVADAVTKKEAFAKEWIFDLQPGAQQTLSDTWKPGSWPEKGYVVTAELVKDGKVIDHVSHEAHVWRPKEKKSFMTVERANFTLDGKRWRAHGVNYMPSSGIAAEDGKYFEQWLGARAYDPEIIQRDLDACRDLGLNSVSIFLYHESMTAQNLLDLLRRLEVMGFKANLSLRPGTPIDFEWDQMREMIEYYRLAENDTVFAYDLAWEPMWLLQKDRKRFDRDWEAWIIERYGSIENAEKDWGVPVPRDDAGAITNPTDAQVSKDGEWWRMVAAYRRFLDTLLYKHYGHARALVRSIDPNHMVSFRMTEAADPTMDWGGIMSYDFPYLAAAVDILEPEAYGRIGDWEKIKPGWFQYEYARWAAPHLPMMWAEAGVHAWDMGTKTSPQTLLDAQGKFYEDFYRMLIKSGADGIFWWWYPGGFRYGENSDYGIINPDGTDRPNSSVIRQNAKALLDGADPKEVDYWIVFDRDEFPNGIVGSYSKVKDEFWKAIEEGKTPGLKTAGTGTDSGNCPMLAVGNTECNGSNPPKYLDGYFDLLEVRNKQGNWVKVENGATINVASDQPVVARATVTNLGEATWRNEQPGAVCVLASGTETVRTPISAAVPRFDSARLEELVVAPAGLNAPAEVTITLMAEGRSVFGPKLKVTLAP